MTFAPGRIPIEYIDFQPRDERIARYEKAYLHMCNASGFSKTQNVTLLNLFVGTCQRLLMEYDSVEEQAQCRLFFASTIRRDMNSAIDRIQQLSQLKIAYS